MDRSLSQTVEDREAAMSLTSHAPFFLGDARVDPSGLSIERAGSSQRVEAKVMEVLLTLARKPGQVVARQELEQAVWPGRIVTD